MRASQVPQHKIDAAKEFMRKPLEEQFQTPMPLRDRDFVNMRFEQLAHLVAWYAELKLLGAKPPAEGETQHTLAPGGSTEMTAQPELPAQTGDAPHE